MTPKEQRNEHLAQTVIKNLHRRHIEGFYCKSEKHGIARQCCTIRHQDTMPGGWSMPQLQFTRIHLQLRPLSQKLPQRPSRSSARW